MSRDFVNIHAHTSLGSMLDALNDVNDLFDKVAQYGQRSLAITDHGTLAAHYDAFHAGKRTGVKFIPGCEFYYVSSYDSMIEDDKGKFKKEKRGHLIVLAQNEVGYKNLLKLNFIGFQNHDVAMGRVFPKIDWNTLSQHSDGLIITSACCQSPIAKAIMRNDYDGARDLSRQFSNTFPGKFFLELHPHTLKVDNLDQDFINRQLIKISRELKIPLSTAADTHYLTRDMEKYHDILLAINAKKPVDDPTRHRYGIDEFYVKQGQEIFAFLAGKYGEEVAEEAVSNTVRIADMCEPPDYMDVSSNHLPTFPVKDEKDYEEFLAWRKEKGFDKLPEDVVFMRYRCINTFNKRFKDLDPEARALRWAAVKKEFKVLEGNNFSSYMLINSDFIKWAKDNDILVGIGRGSVGGCMVAYLLDIHGVDPFEYGLLFERFQNAYKKDLPDIDTDFTSAGRDIVQEYVREKYGRDHCAQVSNINTYTPKNVIPDLVKSLRNVMPHLVPPGTNYVSISNKIKATIPDDAKTMESALEDSKELRNFALQAPKLMDYAKAIVGMPKEYSTHAAGMVISDKPIVDFAPLRVDKNGAIAVQYEKNRCEAIGLVKMDFLAISTLDIIDETLKNIKRLGIEDGPKSMEDIPMGDEETYKMIQSGQTRCVFQLGKSGIMPALCKQIKPNGIIDIAIINALGRPSCKNERIEYVKRRFGHKKVDYLHPSLERSLKETYGLCIMEEQLMSVAEDVAGWDLNKADGLRKLTKLKDKGKDLALKLEVEFIEGAMKTHDMSYELAKQIWDEVVGKFAGYGFNKTMHKNTLIMTSDGSKKLENCSKNDEVYAVDDGGNICKTKVIALHDHGIVPLWEVEFNDGTKEVCTLDHKWLTPRGKLPLWEILERDEGVAYSSEMDMSRMSGNIADEKAIVCTQEGMPITSKNCENWIPVHKDGKVQVRAGVRDNSCWSKTSSRRLCNVQKRKEKNKTKNTSQIQSIGSYEENCFRYGKENFCQAGNTLAKIGSFKKMERKESRRIFKNNAERTGVSKKIENGNMVGTKTDCHWVSKKYKVSLSDNSETGRFYKSEYENNYRSGWPMAFFTGSWARDSKKNSSQRSNIRSRGPEKKRMAADPDIHGELQELWRNYFKQKLDSFRKTNYERSSPKQNNSMYRKIVRINYVGKQQGYDLEVNHPAHNFILSSGLVTSNSHAVFYSINGYITAYLKRHYPAAFIAAYLKIKTMRGGLHKDEEINITKTECRRLKIKIVPPDVNRSGTGYEVLDNNTIVMGLAAIKGLGERAVEELVAGQPYESFVDFLNKTDGRVINKSKLEALAKAGCFDSLNLSRKAVHDEGKAIRDKLNAHLRKKTKDGYDVDMAIDDFSFKFKDEEEWKQEQLLRYELEVLGELVSGSLHDLFPGFFNGRMATPISRLKMLPDRFELVVEVVIKTMLREFKIKKDGRYKGLTMVKYQVEDIFGGQTELTIWPSLYDEAKRVLRDGEPLRAKCRVSEFNGAKTLMLVDFEKTYR